MTSTLAQQASSLEQQVAQDIQTVAALLNDANATLRQLLQDSVQTMDAIINEEFNAELPSTTNIYQFNVPPQTRQWVQVNGIFVAIVVPTEVTAPTITVTNAWCLLGDTYINLNAVINSAAGTGGTALTNLGKLLDSNDQRLFTIVASANFPQGAYISALLTGLAIPATLGGKLT
jgi:hypothetical protein